jgi:PhnB protein
MELEPYLHFSGACEEALTFYKEVFAGEVVSLMRFGDMTDSGIAPDYKDKVMHASFKSPDLKFMASDHRPGTPHDSGSQVSLSLSTRDVVEGERVFAMLGVGGKVTMPMEDTFWGARFGMLTDRFGVHWMVNAEKA